MATDQYALSLCLNSLWPRVQRKLIFLRSSTDGDKTTQEAIKDRIRSSIFQIHNHTRSFTLSIAFNSGRNVNFQCLHLRFLPFNL